MKAEIDRVKNDAELLKEKDIELSRLTRKNMSGIKKLIVHTWTSWKRRKSREELESARVANVFVAGWPRQNPLFLVELLS